MPSSSPRVDGDARLDELRRRLYRVGATEEDLRRYTAEQAALGAPEPEAPRPAEPRRAPPRVLAVVAGGAAIVAIAVLAVAAQPHPERVPAGSPGARSTEQVMVQDVGDGRTLTVRSGAVSGPRSAALSVDGAAAAGQLFQGTGNAVVAVDPPSLAPDGGRAAVTLTSADPSRISWRALRLVTRKDWTSYLEGLAEGGATDGSVVVERAFTFDGAPPTRIAVSAPAGRRWTLSVAVTSGTVAALR